MIKVGLLSITFRTLSVQNIIDLAIKSGLEAIEWGGDIHVPHGDIELATQVGELTRSKGIAVSAYGSYYKVGVIDDSNPSFQQVLDSAIALQAPTIRVWAGNLGSDKADSSYWSNVIYDAKRIADLAVKHNISISFEYHGNTLTDTCLTTTELIDKLSHPNIYTFWQPSLDESIAQREQSLQQLMPWLTNVHVFHWDSTDRLDLSDGYEEWSTYFKLLNQANKDCYASLEFVKDDKPDQFLKDASTLLHLRNQLI